MSEEFPVEQHSELSFQKLCGAGMGTLLRQVDVMPS